MNNTFNLLSSPLCLISCLSLSLLVILSGSTLMGMTAVDAHCVSCLSEEVPVTVPCGSCSGTVPVCFYIWLQGSFPYPPTGSPPFLGEIFMIGGACRNTSQTGSTYVAAQGQLLSINQNQALFSILGTTYGGNGVVNFALPDFRGCKVPCGAGP